MLVHGVKASQHLPEALGADGDHQREADGGVVRVPTANPIPEGEHVGGVDAEFGDPFGVGRYCHKVPGYRRLIPAQALKAPVPGGGGVGQCLQRVPALGAHDEERLGRVEVPGRLHKVGAVDVGHKSEGEIRPSIVSERLVGHHRTQVGAPDPDVDDVAYGLASVSPPAAVADPLRELSQAVQHLVDCGHDVLPVDHDGFLAGRSQSHVKHRPVLGDVDLFAPEHGLDAVDQATLLGQPHQQLHGLSHQPVLGVVEVDATGVYDQPPAPAGVLREEVPQLQRPDFGEVLLQLLEGKPLPQGKG